ncbi:hypothetical protein P5G50_18330 [Leifsonia sp. F6_8S_P_1B]|uniref:Major tail protein n=1 Tax=Leifsonia williamsii TaxID=3035919 RepID=A0ABT8KJ99_9MICO|nr:hypothetical protein [Leifsonia williamsii]MDN4616409.1 hypothetical protein [Leifsonia williamsii]
MATGTLDSAEVNVAVTGAWYVAPTGTTGPTSASSELPDAFHNLGYLSEDGTTRTTDRSTNDIKAWQRGALVRTVTTDASVSYQLTLIQTNRETVELYFGTTVNADGSFDVDPSSSGGRKSFVFDVLDGDDIIRVWMPDAEISEVGDQVYSGSDPIGYEITIKAYASAAIDGATERRFYPALATANKASAAPGTVFPAEATVTAQDSTNAGKLAALGYVANPTTAWTSGQKITVGSYDFNWSGTAWAAGAHA